MAKGKAIIVGRVEVLENSSENFKHDLALVVVFDSAEDVREALAQGRCEFYWGSSASDTKEEHA